MKCIIFVNPFGTPKESVFQANRLKDEFEKKGVFAEIFDHGFLKNRIENGVVISDIDCDFAVFLDKDKYCSACLEKSGIKIFNSHSAIRVCDDKAETYIALSGVGVKMPDTIFAPVCYGKSLPIDKSAIISIGQKLEYPVIIKESFGSKGKGVFKADTESELLNIAEELKTTPHLFQEYIGYKKGVDVRMIVIGGQFVTAMIRENKNDFRSNIALGGQGKKFLPPQRFIEVAEICAKTLKLDYCGVDLLFGKNDEPIVCEVNSNAFIGEIEKVTGVNIAAKYAEYIIKTVKADD